MQLADVDWGLLRGATIVSFVSLAISGSLIFGGAKLASDAALEYSRDQQRYSSARQRYLTLDDEERLIREFAPQFAALQEQGLIGEEQRLSWVETLRAVAVGLKLPSLQYEISAQRELRPSYTTPAGTFKVYGTEMKLTMGLLHEGDLPAVLTALTQAARGQFSVEGCSLVRNSRGFSGPANPRQPNLDVECRLTWLLIRKPEPSS
ncbi:MAG: hypothetical protein HOI95_24730 [Chromatiales bacterium]|jgi:hypothetical protein|nr:hypothetical protein [Chromatiales bacterium]